MPAASPSPRSSASRWTRAAGGGGPMVLRGGGGKKGPPAASVRAEREQGWLRTWEPLPGDNGHLGCGVVAGSPGALEGAEAEGNQLGLGRSAPGTLARYYAGAGWDRS